MSKENNGGPAFPTDNEKQTGPNTWHHSGMSLRDYFAAKAMQALIAQNSAEICELTPEGRLIRPSSVAIPPLAYKYADAMLEAREK